MAQADDAKCARDFYIGNTSIKIRDDFCREKTKEEIAAILKRLSVSASLAFSLAKAKGPDKENH